MRKCSRIRAFGRLLLPDQFVAAEMDLPIYLVGNDIIPIGEAGIEFGDPLLPIGDLLLVFVLLAFVILLDPGAFGSFGIFFCRRDFFRGGDAIVPVVVVLHEGNAPAFDGVGNNGDRFAAAIRDFCGRHKAREACRRLQ